MTSHDGIVAKLTDEPGFLTVVCAEVLVVNHVGRKGKPFTQ